MDVVIDAEVVGWYCQTELRTGAPPCTCDPGVVFDRLGQQDIAWVDDQEMIESEWRSASDPDWFDAWYAERLSAGDVSFVTPSSCRDVLRDLETRCGFPRTRDRWYVRVAKTRAQLAGQSVGLIAEDLDFFEPKAKQGRGNRSKILDHCSGCVVKRLKRHKIDVRTIARHAGQD